MTQEGQNQDEALAASKVVPVGKWFLALVFVLTSSGLFAQNFLGLAGLGNQSIDWGTEVSGAEVARAVSILEAKDWRLKKDQLTPIAQKIPLNARYSLYDKYKVQGAWGFLNLYGVGSIFQGDPGTSLITIGGVVAGETIAIISSQRLTPGTTQNIWVGTGAAVAGASLVYGLIRPWFFADEQNRGLKTALFGSD